MTIHPARAKHGNYKPVKAKEPLVKELLSIIDQQPESDFMLSVHIGTSHQTISQWRNGHASPRLDIFQAVLNYLGYELKIVRKQ
jgi:transcriptional regulator with XRE-family HTH domain